MARLSPILAALTVTVALLASATAGARTLQQSEPSAIQPPAGSTVKFTWHAVGTQNYSAQASTQYGNNQAVARLFKGQTDQLIGFHFFNDADQPVFTQVDASNNQIGFVAMSKAANAPQSSAPDDGGFGSVPLLLLNTVSAGGTLSDVTHVQRLNTKGGAIPTGLFTLPGFLNIGNAELAIPYQADYRFFSSSSSSTAGR